MTSVVLDRSRTCQALSKSFCGEKILNGDMHAMSPWGTGQQIETALSKLWSLWHILNSSRNDGKNFRQHQCMLMGLVIRQDGLELRLSDLDRVC